MKLEASKRLLAEAPVIAPSNSFKDENEDKLKNWQSQSEKTEHTDNEPAGTEASSTAVSEGVSALPQTENSYARLLKAGVEDDPQTMAYEDACSASDGATGGQSGGSTADGYVPNSETGFNIEGPDVDKNYLNVRGNSTGDDELLADADPKLWNNAYQPMG
jgi:hypothetical protein